MDVVLGTVLAVVLLAVIAWVTGRLLGLRRGFVRTTISVLGGVVIAIGAVIGVYGTEALRTEGAGTGVVGVFGVGVVLGTMLVSVLLEAVLRTRPGGHRALRPLRSARRRIAITGRLIEIARAARRHGLADPRMASRSRLLGTEGGRAVRATLEDCGGVMVKFGQIASTRGDLLPAEFCDQLATLRSAAPPLPATVVREEVERELGVSLDSVFLTFDESALAAASIGVTHRAIRLDGRQVVVKVQRPGMDEKVARDAAVLRAGTAALERRLESARAAGLGGLVDELLHSVVDELDAQHEARNNIALRGSAAATEYVKVPEVHTDLTTSKLLVMDLVPGIPLDTDRLATSEVPRSELADRLLTSFLEGLVRDGVFHADPHPGNIMIVEDSTMYWIDCGAVGILDAVTLEGLQQLALGFTLEDPSIIARALRRIAGPAGERFDMGAVEFEVSAVLSASRGGGISPEVLAGVLHILRSNHVAVPPTLTLLSRAFVTLDGTLSFVDPTFAMAPRARGLLQSPSPNLGGLREQATTDLFRALPSLRPLPQLVEDIALQARGGRLSLRLERYGDDRLVTDRWVDRVVLSAMGTLGLIASAIVLVAAGLPGNDVASGGMRVVGFMGLTLAFGVLLRVSAQLLRRSPPDDTYNPQRRD